MLESKEQEQVRPFQAIFLSFVGICLLLFGRRFSRELTTFSHAGIGILIIVYFLAGGRVKQIQIGLVFTVSYLIIACFSYYIKRFNCFILGMYGGWVAIGLLQSIQVSDQLYFIELVSLFAWAIYCAWKQADNIDIISAHAALYGSTLIYIALRIFLNAGELPMYQLPQYLFVPIVGFFGWMISKKIKAKDSSPDIEKGPIIEAVPNIENALSVSVHKFHEV